MDQIKKTRAFFIFLVFTLVAFIYRSTGITDNNPFWVDEFSSANQARLILDQGLNIFNNPDVVFDAYHVGFHSIMAIFFAFLGESEFVARLPSLLAGSLLPGFIFLLGYRVLNFSTGISSGLLSIASYFLITWSRQARGYVFIQLYIVITSLLYFEITQHKSKSWVLHSLFIFFIIIGLLTHSFFYIYLITLAFHFGITNGKSISTWVKKPNFYILLIAIISSAYLSGFLPSLVSTYRLNSIVQANNLWYYHSFLWREYSLITYLSLLGFVLIFLKNSRFAIFLGIYFFAHLLFINFLFAPYVSRYLLPLWPFILLLASFTIYNFASNVSSKMSIPVIWISILLSLAIIINGDKFVVKPKQFYSVNHDFREIALIDYHSFYSRIKDSGELENKKTAIIDTWPDRIFWYVGRDYPASYLFRWENEAETTNGLLRKTYISYNDQGEKILPRQNKLRFIGDLKDLKRAMQKYQKGFIVIDDDTMSAEVIEYVKKNFKKEIYLDHYPLDDNPYSIWPSTLYSWGI